MSLIEVLLLLNGCVIAAVRALHIRAARALNIQMTLAYFRVRLELPPRVELLPSSYLRGHSCYRGASSFLCVDGGALAVWMRQREVNIVEASWLGALGSLAWFRTNWRYHISGVNKMIA